jgi:hypothetical protein
MTCFYFEEFFQRLPFTIIAVMPILTSILLVLTGLALISLTLRSRPKERAERRSDYSERKLELGAQICEAAARDAFGVDLDHTDASLSALDQLITEGWTNPVTVTDDQQDTLYVFGAYIGDVLVRHHQAEWHTDAKSTMPCLYFNAVDFIASPFEIIERKLQDPEHFRITEAVEHLLAEVEARKNGNTSPAVPPPAHTENIDDETA